MKPRAAVLLAIFLAAAGCGDAPAPKAASATAAPSELAPKDVSEPAPDATPLPAGMAPLLDPFTGDLDAMVERRVVRVLTVLNPVLYYVDKGREIGLTYEAVQAFEDALNKRLGNKVVTVHVVLIPVPRDELLPRLAAGQGDIAAAALTVTPARKQVVDFSRPFASDVREVLVTGPSAPAIATIDDLAGQELYVRPSSSYAEHLKLLNARFAKQGKPPVTITPADEMLEDGDILEMVNAGLVPATVVDGYMADIYLQVFPGLRRHAGVESPPVEIAWAFRKNSPKLAAAIDDFVKRHQQGTLAGNVLIGKYLKTTKWVKNARSEEDRRRFLSMAELFRIFGDCYVLYSLLLVA